MQYAGGCWTIVKPLPPGIYQYKFIVETDSTRWTLDPLNPATVANYNGTSSNSTITVRDDRSVLLRGYEPKTQSPMNDSYPITGGTLYLNIIWHQHQPLYLDPATDQLQGPWVRTHGTKDYYDMASIFEKYPRIHATINLTSSLLLQLEEYYVRRISPYLQIHKNRIDARRYFADYRGKTDPWVDLALKPTKDFDARDIEFLLTNVWNAFGVSDVVIGRFPEYRMLKEKLAKEGPKGLNEQEMREVKFWFYIANFDPDFLESKVKLANRLTVDLSDLIDKHGDGTYRLKKVVSEDDCNRIVAETVKILSAIIPVHRKIMYHPASYKGQVEIITTPYTHPILPLIYDSDLARTCQPNDPMPARFHYPVDADAQITKAVAYYKSTFGILPAGMWPAEGSVSEDIIPVFLRRRIQWIATDQKILERSKPGGQPVYYPYAIPREPGSAEAAVIVFRETALSDKIGFTYQSYRGEDAADDFVRSILAYAPPPGQPDRLLTVILDGENAWEWYRYDNDGKEFQNALYRKLSALYESKQVITTTVSEYLHGNPHRGVPAHPVERLPKLEWLWPGSWINGNYDTWIGEDEENRAWEYLRIARSDLEGSGLKQPDPWKPAPPEKTKSWYGYRAWESMYAAEGSDWFWWYGTDQTAPAGDKPFDLAYITHLKNIYRFAKLAGASMPTRVFEPIIADSAAAVPPRQQGAMARGTSDLVHVVFKCNAREIYVRKAVYIAGNVEALGNWTPNKIRMYDDGTHGDEVGDGIWSLEVDLPEGTEVDYKYTNSGAEGSWDPGDEFPSVSRTIRVRKDTTGLMIVRDVFGKK